MMPPRRQIRRQGRWVKAPGLGLDLHGAAGLRVRGALYQVMGPWLPIPVRLLIGRATGRGLILSEYSLMRKKFAAAHGIGSLPLDAYYRGKYSRSLRWAALSRTDTGSAMEALFRLGGVLRTDATGDRRVVEYCLSIPVEQFCERGIPRSSIRNVMPGWLPEQVRMERRRGKQAADFAVHFQAELPEAYAELARMRESELIARAIDLESMESLLGQLARAPQDEYFADGSRLLRALSLGRFLRRMEDGTLFCEPAELSETLQ